MSEQANLSSYQYGSEAKIWERLIFNFRPVLLLFFLVATVALVYQTVTKTKFETNFLKMIPANHHFINNMKANLDDLGATGTFIQIAVEHTEGDIFDKEYLELFSEINDAVYLTPGVNRNGFQSIFDASIRWIAVTEEGFEGGPVLPDGYSGWGEKALEDLKINILRSGRVGSVVSDDFKSAMIFAYIYDESPSEIDPETGEKKKLDYYDFAQKLEKIRTDFETKSNGKVKLHIIGLSKLIGDLTEGGESIAYFFIGAFVITLVLLFLYTRCLVGTLAPLVCSVIAVIWQLGLLATLGLGISAYSMLVPFLVFAIGVSHGIQIINAIAMEQADGANAEMSARNAFRSLYVAGITALISDGIGFITLLIIDIEVIQELAYAASIGVAVIVLTNLVLLPIILSYTGITKRGIAHVVSKNSKHPVLWEKLSALASPKVAIVSVILGLAGYAVGLIGGADLKIGDLDKGAPELHPDSVYNLDNAYISDNYSVSSDSFVIMVKTDKEQCVAYENLEAIDRFGWHMENVEGVQSSVSIAFFVRQVIVGINEGNLKWGTIPRDQALINSTLYEAPKALINTDCSFVPLVLFLDDHKAETLNRVVAEAVAFIEENDHPINIELPYEEQKRSYAKTEKLKTLDFMLATGSAGVEAATNDVIEDAQLLMLVCIYVVVIFLIFLSFNSLAAVACIVIPLALTSVLCQALMAKLGIGVKVATLPVIALGVGIGVDYGIYIYGKLESYLKQGMALQEAYFNTLKTTGKAVALTGIALAIGVGTWIWSPIKFQADMGKLLTFMFLWNMIGALWLLPALANFLIKPEKVVAKAERKEQKKLAKKQAN